MKPRYGPALIVIGCILGPAQAADELRQSVPQLVLQLADSDPGKRATAAKELGKQEQLGPEADAALHKALADESRIVRGRAAVVLWEIEPEPVKELLSGLLAARDDPDEQLRARAEKAWTAIGPGVRGALPYLVRSLATGGDPRALDRAVEALAKPGLEAFPAMFDALDDRGIRPRSPQFGTLPDVRLIQAAAQALSRAGKSAVPVLHEALQDSSPEIRAAAAEALGIIGADARPALPALIHLFDDRDSTVRVRAANALMRLGPAVPGTEKALAAAINHRDANVRRAAVNALAPLADRPVEVASALVRALGDPDASIRLQAADALCRADPPPREALLSLVEELRGRESAYRDQAAQQLDKLGQKIAPVRDEILTLVASRDTMTRLYAARVLVPLGGEDAKKASKVLHDLLGDDSPAVRVRAADVLWKQGEFAEALPVLIAAAGSSDSSTSSVGRLALSRINAQTPGVDKLVPYLIDALADDNPAARSQVLSLLQRLGAAARPASTAVTRLLASADDNTRVMALNLLNTMGGPTVEAIPDLIAALGSSNTTVRTQAARMIQQFGSRAKEAVPAIKKVAAEGPIASRIHAMRVLKDISPADVKDLGKALGEVIGGKDVNARNLALQFATELGPEAKDAVPAIKDQIKSADAATKVRALRALQKIVPADLKGYGPVLADIVKENNPSTASGVILLASELDPAVTKEMLPAVLEALKSPDPRLRQAATSFLMQLPARSLLESRPALIAALPDSEPDARFRIASVLRSGGVESKVVIPWLVKLLDHAQSNVRLRAAEELYQHGDAGMEAARPFLLKTLQGSAANDRLRAARLLIGPGESAEDRKAAVAALDSLLRDGESNVRSSTVLALQNVDPRLLKAAAGGLREAVKDSQPTTRLYAAQILVKLDGDDRDLGIKVLAELANDRTPQAASYRSTAASALRSLGPEGQKAYAPFLIESLKDPAQRRTAAMQLSFLDRETAKKAIPALVQMLGEDQPQDRITAAEALARIGGTAERKAAGEAIVALLKQKDRLRVSLPAAAAVLRKLGPEWIKAATAAYREILLDETTLPFTRISAARVLVSEGPEERKIAVPVLDKLMKESKVPFERLQAAELLAQADPSRVSEAAEVLVELTRDPQTRLTAARTLIQLGPDHVGPAVAVLRQELSQGQPSRRPAAANLLGQIGPKASAAIPELTALLNSPSETGVMQAAEALGRIGGDGTTVLVKALNAPGTELYTAASRGLIYAGPEAASAVPDLIRLAGDETKTPTVRATARLVLGRVGTPAFTALLKELGEDSPARRRTAAETFLSFGTAAAPARSVLEKAAGDEDPLVRVPAARAALVAGSTAKPVIEALVEGLRSSDVVVRRGVAVTVSEVWPLPENLIEGLQGALKDSDGHVRIFAAHALARGKETAAEAAPVLIAALRDPALRSSAIRALSDPDIHIPALKGAVPALREILNHPTARRSTSTSRVAVALHRLGDPNAVEWLVETVTSSDRTVPRSPFVWALLECGPDGVRSLQTLLSHPDPGVRYPAIQLLQDEVNDPKILAEVIALTREGDANFRYQAARALRWVKPGPQAETAARAVAELLRNHEPVYETEQAITMSFLHAKTGRTEAIEVLREALKPPHQSSTLTTARAAEALGRFGADARDAIPELVALLGRQEADLRESAAGALGSIGPSAKAAVPALTRLLEDQDLRIRARAAVALWRITARSGPAVPVLAKVLNAPELRQVNGPQPLPAVPMEVAPGVPAIVERFTSTATMPEESLPALVAHALGEMGPAAKPAADALREVARDPDERIRTAAAAALKKIGEE